MDCQERAESSFPSMVGVSFLVRFVGTQRGRWHMPNPQFLAIAFVLLEFPPTAFHQAFEAHPAWLGEHRGQDDNKVRLFPEYLERF